MTFLVLERLSKKFGEQIAVDRLSLAVGKGEFVSLLGPSGCGKTTTLQMIAGFHPPTSGAITLEGHDLTAVKPAQRGLGIVFQSYALFPHMTAAENVAFGLEMQGVARAEREARVKQTLALVGLAAFADRFPRRLSGGQQQRVALARALVIQPRILLLDEPLSNLDAKLREDMQIELRQIQRTLGTTTILVTHDQSEAMALSDRIAVMNQGRVEQVAPPSEAYERPATPFVASFLGASNLLLGELKAQSNGYTSIVTEGGDVLRAGTDMIPPGLSGAVQVGVRPEKITLVQQDGSPPSDRNHVSGVIRMSTYIGVNYQYEVEGPGGHMLRVYVQNLGAAGSHPNAGDRVRLEWLPEHTFVVERSENEPEEGE